MSEPQIPAVTGPDPDLEARIATFADRWTRHDWELVAARPLAPHMNLALDEALTLRVGAGLRKPTLRFWGWSSRAVILGRFQSVKNEVDPVAAAELDVTLARRISGGGAMFIEPEGAITWSIHAPADLVEGMSFPESYAFFDAWAITALRDLGVEAWYAPLNDITSTGGKIGGAAQARRGGAVLHHTTMAYQMNTDLMLRVLRIGKEKLSDKGITSAAKRVGPLRQQTDLPRQTIIDHLIATFGAAHGLTPGDLTAEEIAEAEELVRTRFGTREWVEFLP
jgi:lipoate---protein ligase